MTEAIGANESSTIKGKKILTNTVLLILGSLINLLISLVTTSVIARTLGPELYGKYTFGLSYVMLFSVLANFGIESFFIRESAQDNKNIRQSIMDVLHLKAMLALLTVGTIILSAFVLNYPSSTIKVICVLSVGLAFQILSSTVLSVYKATETMKVLVFFNIFFRVVTAVIILGVSFTDVGLFGIVSAFTIGNILVLVGSYIVFYRDYRLFHIKIQPRAWINLLTSGFPFYVSAIFTMIYARINVIMLSKIEGEVSVGLYMAAWTLVESLYFLPEAVNTALFPAFSRIYGASKSALAVVYVKMMKYTLVITGAIGVGCLLVGGQVLLVIFGEDFRSSIGALYILIFVWVFSFFSNLMSYLLFSISMERAQVRTMGLACVTNLTLNFVWIDAYGFTGSALALAVTEMLNVLIMGTVLWKRGLRYVPDWGTARLIIVLGVMAGGVQSLSSLNILVQVVGGGLLYILGLFLLRVFDKEDKAAIRMILRRC